MKNIFNKKSVIELNKEAGKNLKLNIYGYIGYWDTSSEHILSQIEDSKADEIHVHINSGGGSAFDGIAICNILKSHKAKVIAHIDGWAASAASIIAMGADEIVMPSNTMMMIHKASTFESGNADVLEKTANDLRKVDKAVKASYKQRFIGEDEELEKLLNEETWLTADEAKALGFADVVSDEIEFEEPIEMVEEKTKDQLVAKYSNKKDEKEPNKKEGSFNLLKKWR